MTERFQMVDTKFKYATSAIQSTDIKVAQIDGEVELIKMIVKDKSVQLESVKTDVPQRLAAIMEETTSYVGKRRDDLERCFSHAQGGFHRFQLQSEAFRAEIKPVSSSACSGGGSGTKTCSLIDSRSFELNSPDGNKDSTTAIDEWREDMEEHVNSYLPISIYIMEIAARRKFEINNDEVVELTQELNIDAHQLTWRMRDLNGEAATLMKKKLAGRARKAFTTAQHGLIDAYRKMLNETNPVNARKNAVLIDSNTGMIGRGESKTATETKSRVFGLQVLVTHYLNRVGELPAEGILASALSNILDDKTRESFTNAQILSDDQAVSMKISTTATESDTSGDRMGSGNIDVNAGASSEQSQTPVNTCQANVVAQASSVTS